MSKYRYYFRKPKSEIAKDILGFLMIGGIIAIAATSPFFIVNIIKGFKGLKKYPNKKVYDNFYKLKKQGLVDFYEKNNQIYIFLTEKGKKKAGWMQIDALRIEKPKKWDGKWRILLFDIMETKKFHREALRGKLIELGFRLLQKSAWIIPYECKDEIGLLKSFFGLSDKEVKLVVAKSIEGEKELEERFKLV
jgi:DNA-binding transcriptional regulator PaaX